MQRRRFVYKRSCAPMCARTPSAQAHTQVCPDRTRAHTQVRPDDDKIKINPNLLSTFTVLLPRHSFANTVRYAQNKNTHYDLQLFVV
jgi:hypothetical protein